MKNYIRPIAEVSKFDVADIITTSGIVAGADTLSGVDATLYESYKALSEVDSANVAVFQW
jgi:hypothetical protein